MQASRRRVSRALWVVLLLSFVPYFLPYEMQPSAYHDGLTTEQRRDRAEYQRLQRTLGGGDLQRMGDFFDGLTTPSARIPSSPEAHRANP